MQNATKLRFDVIRCVKVGKTPNTMSFMGQGTLNSEDAGVQKDPVIQIFVKAPRATFLGSTPTYTKSSDDAFAFNGFWDAMECAFETVDLKNTAFSKPLTEILEFRPNVKINVSEWLKIDTFIIDQEGKEESIGTWVLNPFAAISGVEEKNPISSYQVKKSVIKAFEQEVLSEYLFNTPNQTLVITPEPIQLPPQPIGNTYVPNHVGNMPGFANRTNLFDPAPYHPVSFPQHDPSNNYTSTIVVTKINATLFVTVTYNWQPVPSVFSIDGGVLSSGKLGDDQYSPSYAQNIFWVLRIIAVSLRAGKVRFVPLP